MSIRRGAVSYTILKMDRTVGVAELADLPGGCAG